MTQTTKQAVLTNGAFYIVQSVEDGGTSYALGDIDLKGYNNSVEFNTFFKNESVSGSEPEFWSHSELVKYLDTKVEPTAINFNFKGSDFKDYESRFTEFMNHKELKKAVLFKAYTSKMNFPDLNTFLFALKSLLEKTKNLNGHLYGFYDQNKKRALLGFSPELLYEKLEDQYLIHAVAGTQEKRHFKPWSEKLTSEHKMVEESVKDTLTPLKVSFSEAQTAEYGELVHLKSLGQITDEVDEEALVKLHPTSAVGTLPHKYHKSFELGPSPRGFFGGYVRVKSKTKSFAVVLIRGVEFREKQAMVCVGGGVLKNSKINEEWLELQAKWSQLQSLWGLKKWTQNT